MFRWLGALGLLLISAQNVSAPAAWLEARQDAWKVTPLLNVGDAVQDYRMVGIPDGLGAMLNADGTLSVFMNHELATEKGAARRHGAKGAFVSHWLLDVESLKVVRGDDWIQRVMVWCDNNFVEDKAVAFNRLCSADLPSPSALFNATTGKGYQGRLFLNGEEDKNGRAFAHVVSGDEAGTSYELPHLGKFSWENAVANPATGDLTLVMGMDDTKPKGQVYVYLGRKQATGSPVQRAGLVGGNLFAVKMDSERFSLLSFGDVSAWDAARLEQAGDDAGATAFLRPEDGAWDTRDPKVFYFATTDKLDGNSQLYRMIFDDLAHPEKGGTIKVVLNAREIGAQMFDNLTVNVDSEVLLEEDPGDASYLAGLWKFDPFSGKAERVAESAPERFKKGGSQFLTEDEENSGIIEITSLVSKASWAQKDKRYYLGVLQAHAKSSDPELVEDGQWYLLEGPAR